MTAQGHPFVRVYYGIIDDPKFARVYCADRALATWLRLLIAADAMYPAPAPIPRTTHDGTFRLLVEVGLLMPVGDGHFRVVGLVREREGRYAGGKGRRQYPSDGPSDSEYTFAPTRTPTRNDGRSPSRDARDASASPLLSYPDQSSPILARETVDVLDDYWRLTGTYPIGTKAEWLTRLGNEFGHGPAGQALAGEYATDGDRRTLLSRTEGRLRHDAHEAELERAKPRPRKRETEEERARIETERKALLEEWAAQVKGPA